MQPKLPKEVEGIKHAATQRGISRLCHFTPSRNLSHILKDQRGVLASSNLNEDEKAIFNPTDLERLDGNADSVCCSIQYPNAWYFRTSRSRELLFKDWVVLYIEPHYLWKVGTKFCPHNAAVAHGSHIETGTKGFASMFDEKVRQYERSQNHPDFLPTDEQAEVLIPDNIGLKDIKGIAVRNEEQAKLETARFRLLNLKVRRLFVVPELFDPQQLSNIIRNGHLPVERIFNTQLG